MRLDTFGDVATLSDSSQVELHSRITCDLGLRAIPDDHGWRHPIYTFIGDIQQAA